MSRLVPLTKGYTALIDEADWPVIAPHRWRVSGKPDRRHGLYAVTTIDGRSVYMHRLILGARPEQVGDHVNGDGLDNRRANLRACSRLQNDRNKRKREGREFKGVVFQRRALKRPWCAAISIEGRLQHLGLFATPIEAARAYDLAAAEHYGEFANLNFSPQRDWLFPHEHAGRWPAALSHGETNV